MCTHCENAVSHSSHVTDVKTGLAWLSCPQPPRGSLVQPRICLSDAPASCPQCRGQEGSPGEPVRLSRGSLGTGPCWLSVSMTELLMCRKSLMVKGRICTHLFSHLVRELKLGQNVWEEGDRFCSGCFSNKWKMLE